MSATAKPVEGLHPNLVADIKRRGVWRCGVIQPDCKKPPVADFVDDAVTDDSGKSIHRLFCREHTREYCIRAGIQPPVYPKDGN